MGRRLLRYCSGNARLLRATTLCILHVLTAATAGQARADERRAEQHQTAGSGTRSEEHVAPKVHWLSNDPMPVWNLKSKFSGAQAVFAPRSGEVTLPARVNVSVNEFDAPGARSPPPPAQVGPVEVHTSTVWNGGKLVGGSVRAINVSPLPPQV
jgi:hypothetical protein